MDKTTHRTGGIAVQRRSKKWKLVWKNWQLYLFVLPAFLSFAFFSYAPMYGVQIAFKEYNPGLGIWGSPWAQPWYRYFKLFFDSAWFTTTLKNTLTLSFYMFILGNILPLLLALMINEAKHIALPR